MVTKRLFLRVSIGLIIILLLVNIIASFYFYNLAIDRNVKDFLQNNADLEVSAEALDVFLDGDWRSWVREQEFTELSTVSFDNLELQGYLLEAKEPTNKVVLMTHGYLGNGKQMGLYGQYYYEELGYHFFTADMRGHGASEGNYIGFGWHDRLDVISWIDVIIDHFGNDVEIVLHGLSMGAATVLMTSGEKLPSNVKAIIADSPYTSVYDLFAYQMKRMFYLPAIPILPTTSLVTKMKADYSLIEASALRQVSQATVPILYIHGDSDTFVPTKMAQKLYEQTSSQAEILIIDNANHGEAFIINKELYINKMTEFLNKYID